MNWPRFNRKSHYWVALASSVPILIVVCTGILLLVKKDFAWIQPPEQRTKSREPKVAFDTILESCRIVPEAGIDSWADVDRVDVRPRKGLIKVISNDNWEVQLHIETGEVLQVEYRRSDIIETMHDGSWFHESATHWVFLPAAVMLLFLWLTGMYLFVVPYWVKARRGGVTRTSPDGPTESTRPA